MNPHLKNVKRKWLNWSWNSHLNFSKQKMHTRRKCIIRHSRKRLPIFDIWRDYKFKWTWETYLGPNKSICHTKQERVCYNSWMNTRIFRYQLYHVDCEAAECEVLLECSLSNDGVTNAMTRNHFTNIL